MFFRFTIQGSIRICICGRFRIPKLMTNFLQEVLHFCMHVEHTTNILRTTIFEELLYSRTRFSTYCVFGASFLLVYGTQSYPKKRSHVHRVAVRINRGSVLLVGRTVCCTLVKRSTINRSIPDALPSFRGFIKIAMTTCSAEQISLHRSLC
jgi:hypothetical protein